MLIKSVVFIFGIAHAVGIMCNGALPLHISGRRVFCGRGVGSVACPTGFVCEIDPGDAYAVCCPVASFTSSSSSSSSSSASGSRPTFSSAYPLSKAPSGASATTPSSSTSVRQIAITAPAPTPKQAAAVIARSNAPSSAPSSAPTPRPTPVVMVMPFPAWGEESEESSEELARSFVATPILSTQTTTSSVTTSSSTQIGARDVSAAAIMSAMGTPPANLTLARQALSRYMCSQGVPYVSCYLDPCTVAKCPGVQGAQCISYPCGGCNALWYGPSGALLSESQCQPPASGSKCPFGSPLKNYQGTELFCGRGANRVDCPPGTSCQVDPADRFAVCCAPGGSSCPPGILTANCYIDPCVATACPGVQGAKCVSNYCGGCNALWYNANGGLLTAAQCISAQSPTCPPGLPLVQCYVEPCSVTTCPGVKDAKCTADYCGGCNAVWKNAAGTVLSARQCSTPLVDAKCASGERALVNSQGAELFCGRGTNRVQCPPGSVCTVDSQDRFAVCCSSSACPAGVPTVSCFVNPCQFATCAFKDAKCVTNFCGGCNALWFTPSGGLLTDSQCRSSYATPCPGGVVGAVQCFVDPCLASSCPSVRGAKCAPNYCGACTAVWSSPTGSVLTDAQCHADSSKCPSGGVALRNSQGADLFCGRGAGHVDCPPSSTCVIDPADRFAVCCQRSECPTGVPVATCFINPCSVASCPRVRDAKCVNNYCGGCNALWYHPNGGLLSDRECRVADTITCPADKPAVLCYIDPCLLAVCPGTQGAKCVSDFCGGCNAQWYGPYGNLLTSKQCELVSGPVRYLNVRTLSAETDALATWASPNGTLCGVPYVAEMSYDGRAWSALPLEQPFSVFSKFTVTPKRTFQVRVAPQGGPALVETYTPPTPKRGKN